MVIARPMDEVFAFADHSAEPRREKLADRHFPAETAVDRMLRLGGIDRESRFKQN